jgi:UrcA family protein
MNTCHLKSFSVIFAAASILAPIAGICADPVPQVRVAITDVNLSNPQGIATLYRRLQQAAAEVCGHEPQIRAGDGNRTQTGASGAGKTRGFASCRHSLPIHPASRNIGILTKSTFSGRTLLNEHLDSPAVARFLDYGSGEEERGQDAIDDPNHSARRRRQYSRVHCGICG